jgi:ABC-type bacteriocin/lantibiotic exporter with double-glycine peptidase domain
MLLIMATWGMKHGAFTLTDYVVLSGFIGFTAEPVMEISEFFSLFQMAKISKQRLKTVYELDQEGTGGTLDPVHGGNIEIKDLVFRYPGAVQDTLRHLDIEIPKGSSAAIVGESGCGKSTLVNLLLRLYDHSEGSIRIGPTDIRHFDLEKLRRQIGYVTQSVTLFDTTIRENIDLEGGFTDHEVMAACELACLGPLLAKLPKGIQSKVGERGSMISGGEKQRIGLARALCSHPSILVLDEPTSAVDPETEREILESLASIRSKRPDLTLITISHNVKMLNGCDLVFYLSKGAVLNRGTHAQLADRDPAYRDLFQLGQPRPWVAA